MGIIEVGMVVKGHNKKKKRIVVGLFRGFVYLRHDDDPWKVDICMVDDFWDVYKLIDDSGVNYGC